MGFGDGAQILDLEFLSKDTASMGHSNNVPKLFNPPAKVHVCTVSCSWFNPSRIVWLHYYNKKWASYTVGRFVKKLEGRQVQTEMEQPPEYHGRSKPVRSVQLENVSAETSEQSLLARLKGIKPDKLTFGKPTSRLTQTEVLDFVKGLLSQSRRKLESFNHNPNPVGSRTKAFARFQSPSDVKSVLSLSDDQYRSQLGSRILFEQIFAITIPVLRDLYSVLKEKI